MLEQLPPLAQRHAHQVVPVIPEYIENIINEIAIGLASPQLQCRKIRKPLFIDNDNLSIENRIQLQLLQRLMHRIKLRVEHFIVPRSQLDLVFFEISQRAKAIPLHFEEPFVLLRGWTIYKGCKHGLYIGRRLGLLLLPERSECTFNHKQYINALNHRQKTFLVGGEGEGEDDVPMCGLADVRII